MPRSLARGLYLALFLLQICLIMRTSLYLTAASAYTIPVATAIPTVVNLNYTSYRGVALDNGVTQWLGVRYAAPPLGDLRFREPQPPEQEDGVQDAGEVRPYCLGTAQGPPSNESAEDCLFMNIFAPSSAKKGSKLPVYFFIQGGGFNTNSNANLNGTGLVEASDMNIVVVNFNYRGNVSISSNSPLEILTLRSSWRVWLPRLGRSPRRWYCEQRAQRSASRVAVGSAVHLPLRWRSRTCHHRWRQRRGSIRGSSGHCIWRPRRRSLPCYSRRVPVHVCSSDR
jgi:hypothetical protein